MYSVPPCASFAVGSDCVSEVLISCNVTCTVVVRKVTAERTARPFAQLQNLPIDDISEYTIYHLSARNSMLHCLSPCLKNIHGTGVIVQGRN
jgi:hypothetical protein